ncbi:DNA polymerase gamma [Martensiomyces pterosporus]|nr:DNA polymerase gamma [Martensiomyces pterosporus]
MKRLSGSARVLLPLRSARTPCRAPATTPPDPSSRLRRRFHSAPIASKDYAEPRKNELDIEMLAPKLREGIFGQPRYPPATSEQIKISIDHLKSQGIYGKETEPVSTTDFALPELQGSNIDEHFQNISRQVAEPYLTMAKLFAATGAKQAPARPDGGSWKFRSGWTRYDPDGSSCAVDHPAVEDGVLVLDVEVLVPESHYPVLATAVSSRAWYGWVSPYLTGDSPHPRHLIPLMKPGQSEPRIVIGHNVGYDRARIQEERLIKRPPLAFIDTMSLHVSSGGLCNQQRLHWVKYSNAKRDNDKEFLRLNSDTGKFFDVSSLNSLKEVAKHYCGITMDKTTRDIFVDGSLQDVRGSFAKLMDYCAGDVEVALNVYSKVFPAFLRKCPHPASFAGVLMMLEGYLPVDRSWPEYIRRSEELLSELSGSVAVKMRELAEDALKVESPTDDPWLKTLDWTVVPQRYTKPRYKADGTYAKNGEPKPYAKQLLPGYPQWYRDLWDTKRKEIRVTVRSRIAPYLLKLKWLGYPLYHSGSYGWTFQQRQRQLPSFTNMKVLEFPSDPSDQNFERIPANDTGAVYFKVPHPDGEAANCGNPLAKNYQAAIDDGTLSSTYAMAKEAMEMNAMCSYWISARERVKSQFVTWDDDVEDAFTGKPLDLGLPKPSGPDKGTGVILPMVVPMGTITRRGVESTWMTASNAKKNRLGSELKSMVRCPAGYRFVGADVDSEELWISALIGDSQFRMHGATAFGWMTLQGTKSAGTDLHSNTARILGIGRGSAKVFNYGRIYGAGVKYATSLLLQFNPDMTEAEAKEKAEKLYASTKGMNMRNKAYFGRSFWHGGTESYMFNQLEAIATSDDPRTPALGCGITDALRKKVAGDRFMTSRVNWVVQSSGVDYLHLLLVSMAYLSRCYSIDLRFVISVHDEVRYMVPEHDVYRAAMALQISNLWVRSLFSYRLGIEDLPQSVAFFSAVDIDHVLRKEVDMECVTPTNATPIPPGVSCGISEILEKTDCGKLEPPEERLRAGFQLSDPRSLPGSAVLKKLAQSVNDAAGRAKPKARALAEHEDGAAEPQPWISQEPDSIWLTSQMLGENTEITQLFQATQCRHQRVQANPKRPGRQAGYSEVKRIAKAAGQTRS